ncbi:MAG: STAS domain-containing protein [Paracoccaceae bacterium]
MEFETGYAGPAFVVRCLSDRVDAAAASEFRDGVRRVTLGSSGSVILDLSRVQFLDSSGLGAIVAVMKFLSPERRLELAAPSANVARVLRLTRMDTVFTIHPVAPAIGATDAA